MGVHRAKNSRVLWHAARGESQTFGALTATVTCSCRGICLCGRPWFAAQHVSTCIKGVCSLTKQMRAALGLRMRDQVGADPGAPKPVPW